MPVTTRAAALRSGANGNLNHSQDQTASTPAVTVKTTRKCPSRRKQTSAQINSVISSAECETHPPSQQQSTNLDPASEVIHRSDREDLVSAKIDATVGTVFANRSSTPPHFSKGTRIHQQKINNLFYVML